MDASAAILPEALELQPAPEYQSLSTLSPGAKGVVISVGSGTSSMTPLERRLLEFGFVSGEHFEVVAEARPGRDPFVVRVGHTALALRRREAETIWVEILRTP
jgi:ferrous iron transport protein A